MRCNRIDGNRAVIPRQICWIIVAALLVLASLSSCLTSSSSEEEKSSFSLRFYPSAATLAGVDSTATVDIVVDKAVNLIAAKVTVKFNPSIFEVTNLEIVGTDFVFYRHGADPYVLDESVDNASGVVEFSVGAMEGGFTGVTGGGTLARLTVKGKAAGTARITYANTGRDEIIFTQYSQTSETGWLKVTPTLYSGTVEVK